MKTHTFHIPVMGIGFTIDTPFKVAALGIDSVISLVDDVLIEKIRKVYCEKLEVPYQEITDNIEDFRAKRITSYLNLMHDTVQQKFETLKTSWTETNEELKNYFNLLPDTSSLKKEFRRLTANTFDTAEITNWLKENLAIGNIDVNIMTKVDKENYQKKEKLPSIYNDAHAALRGFAQSDLSSSLILSAGMNPRLYSYIEAFDDFYPDETGFIKKKIVLKVSDYRSALIQGKFLAKKGIWVSEYRIESGLNCGGHAFATDGYLLGPILAQFRDQKQELVDTIYPIICNALQQKERTVPKEKLAIKISAQGGVGTAEEHQFLQQHYKVNSVGWGSPFLLVPETTSVDNKTLTQLVKAKEEDLYLSDISPLGVPFNSLKGNTKDIEKITRIAKGKPGSPCPKKYVALNKEFNDRGLCTASRQYQHQKIKELDAQELSQEAYQEAYAKIVEKSCTCVGLGTSALLAHNQDTKVEGEGVSICPGPNLAYFSKIMSLQHIVDHIYGRNQMITRQDRPNMFIKELDIYVNYLQDRYDDFQKHARIKQQKQLLNFSKNLNEGISYYKSLFGTVKGYFEKQSKTVLSQLESYTIKVNDLQKNIEAYIE
ncbi:hypothetical protein [Aquimarina rhabdastrellae]